MQHSCLVGAGPLHKQHTCQRIKRPRQLQAPAVQAALPCAPSEGLAEGKSCMTSSSERLGATTYAW